MKIAILLTGTISPENVPNLKRTDPLEREQDYYSAIKQWLVSGYPILFVENSNFNSKRIEQLFSKTDTSEYIKFNSTRSYLGKGNGEAEIIEYAFNNSRILRTSDVVVKVTGRLFIKNFSEFTFQIRNIKEPFVISSFNDNLKFSDSRFILADKKFFLNYLLKDCVHIDEKNSIYFEHIFARSVHRWLADGYSWYLPDRVPLFVGFSGTGNVEYKYSSINIMKNNTLLIMLKYLLGLKP